MTDFNLALFVLPLSDLFLSDLDFSDFDLSTFDLSFEGADILLERYKVDVSTLVVAWKRPALYFQNINFKITLQNKRSKNTYITVNVQTGSY